jgi:midasin
MLPQLASYEQSAIRMLHQESEAKLESVISLGVSHGDPFASSIREDPTTIRVGIFALPRHELGGLAENYSFAVPTTRANLLRLVRACQVLRPILLEGDPGAGKTSLVANLAAVCGQQFVRINLSDQTDLTDLFGTELPVEGEEGSREFAWRDADFLRAMQKGSWVLLDEMNLAPQAVLEGLNAVLDHRGTVFIPELGRTFQRHPGFRVFAAQNPVHQGGGRKGLPKSFLDRFAKVYIHPLTKSDMDVVLSAAYSQLRPALVTSMVAAHVQIEQDVHVRGSYGRDGSPWEFNIRDLLRWAELDAHPTGLEPEGEPSVHVLDLYVRRFRSPDDQSLCSLSLFASNDQRHSRLPWTQFSPTHAQIGNRVIERGHYSRAIDRPFRIDLAQLHLLETMAACVKHGWLVILVGKPSTGKTGAVELLANLHGVPVSTVFLNASTDTSDILGGFEQVDGTEHLKADGQYEASIETARQFGGRERFSWSGERINFDTLLC